MQHFLSKQLGQITNFWIWIRASKKSRWKKRKTRFHLKKPCVHALVLNSFQLLFCCSIIGNTNTFNLRVKIEGSNGLLLWTGGEAMSPASDFLLLGVQNGFLHFRFNLGNGEGGVIYNHTRIDDSKWHRIRATRWEWLNLQTFLRTFQTSCEYAVLIKINVQE